MEFIDILLSKKAVKQLTEKKYDSLNVDMAIVNLDIF